MTHTNLSDSYQPTCSGKVKKANRQMATSTDFTTSEDGAGDRRASATVYSTTSDSLPGHLLKQCYSSHLTLWKPFLVHMFCFAMSSFNCSSAYFRLI